MKQILKLIKEHKILFIIWLILIIIDISSISRYGKDIDLQFLMYKMFIDTCIIFGIGFALNSSLFTKFTNKKTSNNSINTVTNNLPSQNDVSKQNNQKREYRKDNIMIVIGVGFIGFVFLFFLILLSIMLLFHFLFAKKITLSEDVSFIFRITLNFWPVLLVGGVLIVSGIIKKIIKR